MTEGWNGCELNKTIMESMPNAEKKRRRFPTGCFLSLRPTLPSIHRYQPTLATLLARARAAAGLATDRIGGGGECERAMGVAARKEIWVSLSGCLVS